MYKLLSAVDHAHSKGIMHRNINPANIMINDEKGTVKLVNWGLAEYFQMDKDSHRQFLGTRVYKAPEFLLSLEAST